MTLKRSISRLMMIGVAIPMLAACNTIAGVGRDVADLGGLLESGATSTHDAVFGPRQQSQDMASNSGSTQLDNEQVGMTPAPKPAQLSSNNQGSRLESDTVIYFDTGSAELDAEARERVQTAMIHRAGGTAAVRVDGFTDTSGSAEANYELSKRRAEAVANALEAEGILRDSIIVEWHGEESPASYTGDNISQRENRRVTIAFIPVQQQQSSAAN